MKILFIGFGFPYPLHGGGQNLIYHWLEAASSKHDVQMFIVSDQDRALESIPGLPNVKIHFHKIQVSRSPWSRVLRQGSSLVGGTPATSLVLLSSAVEGQLNELLYSNHYDLIVLTENGVAGFAPLLRSSASVLLLKHSVHAVDAAEQRSRYGRRDPRWILEERVVRRFEARTCRAATLVCCVNQEDADQVISRYKLSTPVVSVPLGVDLERFPCRGTHPETKVVGFTGNLTWGANVDAVHWLCREVLPRVWRNHPETRLLAIGPGGENLRSVYGDCRIQFTGRVPSIPEAMEDVSVGVVPIVSGTGMRCKLLDMLSMGIPTVSTPLGAEGISYVDGEHLLIADSGEAFTTSLEKLLSDGDLRRKLSAAGPQLASLYSWASIYPKILNVFELAFWRYHQGAIDDSDSASQSYETTVGAGQSERP